MIPADEALLRLQEGNKRFAAGKHEVIESLDKLDRHEYVSGQQPFAVILGCADSRVPVEIIFDQGLGDLFVIRVAGNIVATSQFGSVEYAAGVLGVRLIVVLGHTGCGAIQATIDELRTGHDEHPANLKVLVERIQPNIESLLKEQKNAEPGEIAAAAVRANVAAAVKKLSTQSEMLNPLIASEELLVIGAEYDLATGLVTFLET